MTSLYITNSICTVWYRHATLKESQTLAKQGLMFFFLCAIVKHQAQSLNSSFSILTTSWNYVNAMALCRRRKKMLIGSVQINSQLPSEEKHCGVLPYHGLNRNIHTVDETHTHTAICPSYTQSLSSPIVHKHHKRTLFSIIWWTRLMRSEFMN